MGQALIGQPGQIAESTPERRVRDQAGPNFVGDDQDRARDLLDRAAQEPDPSLNGGVRTMLDEQAGDVEGHTIKEHPLGAARELAEGIDRIARRLDGAPRARSISTVARDTRAHFCIIARSPRRKVDDLASPSTRVLHGKPAFPAPCAAGDESEMSYCRRERRNTGA